MDTMHTLMLALLQGLTEFLPISSSAHLILVPRLLGWPDQGLAFDVAVHVGTLVAVVTYFRHDIARLLLAWLQSCTRRQLPAMRGWPGSCCWVRCPRRWPDCCCMMSSKPGCARRW